MILFECKYLKFARDCFRHFAKMILENEVRDIKEFFFQSLRAYEVCTNDCFKMKRLKSSSVSIPYKMKLILSILY